MCGIAGIAYKNGRPVEHNVLKSMTMEMQHRGPDDEGIHIIPNLESTTRSANIQIGLGHRRLSIIDLSKTGHQPMTNENETIWVTFNGEIYNFKELRTDLIRQGHVFKSNSDTEVIVHGYEEYGEGIFSKLNGMYAFGLWDDTTEILYLVRDRYGQKPLYYSHSQSGVIFASEIKSLLKHPDINSDIDILNLSRYLSYEYIPGPHSILKDVNKLLPGHYLKWTNDNIITKPYWHINFNETESSSELSVSEIERQLIYLLKSSVKRRMISDVPLGVFLSGGIDSSAIVALMSELIPADKIKTFSIGFDDVSFDESSHARTVSQFFGTDHYEQTLTPNKMLEMLPDIWNFMDEPFADASIIPTYLLSRFTREHVTVALGGDGSDELFAGYDPFQAHLAAKYYEKIPKIIHNKIVSPFINRLPVSTKNISMDFKLKQFMKGIPYSAAIRNQVWLGSFAMDEQRNIFTEDINHTLNNFDPYGDIHRSYNGKKFRNTMDEIIYCYSKFYLADDILTKIDRSSMASSLEVRSPFLDVDFAEFANRIPSEFKMKGLTRKYILKKSLEKKIPKSILYRKKKGFGIPLTRWLKNELKPTLLEVFNPSRINSEGLFNSSTISAMLDDHFSGRVDNRKQIWTLLMFQKWKERFASC